MINMISHSKPLIDDIDRHAVDEVLSSGMIAQGRRVREFEVEATRYLRWADGVAVNSGSAAFALAFKALEIKQGDEVILPTYVCKSVAEAVLAVGAKPVLCDIGPEWTMTAETVAPKVTPRTAAIILVHIFGIRADTYSFRQFNVPIIEDACQAFVARPNKAKSKTSGSIAIFSFHAIKCLTTGEGGMAVSDDADIVERMRIFRDGGDLAVKARLASPMTDMQAVLGLSQLAKCDDFLKRRRDIADRYFTELSDLPIQLPHCIRDHSIFFRFPILIRGNFETYRERFDMLNVQVRRGVDALLHRMFGIDKHQFPTAERLFDKTVSIPIYPVLQDAEVQTVIAACRKIWHL